MNMIALDFETFFTDLVPNWDVTGEKYRLKRNNEKACTTEKYVRHPWFEVHGAAIKWEPDVSPTWYDAAQLDVILAEVDWNDTAIICHHAHFDGLILSHCYGIRPKLWLDTLSMARLLLGNHLSVSLDSVRRHFDMPAKRTPYELFKGKHWHELDQATQRLIADGCEDEVESIWALFHKLAQSFPRSEYPIADMTVRMFTEPTLRGDIDLLAQIWSEENERKTDICADLGIGPADLQSADRFADLLRAEGVEPARKKGKNGDIYAFAKTDDFMKELLDHDDPRVSGLACARLGIKSTAIQTRAETLGHMATRGALCVYLRYAAAGTNRWGGGDGSNFQNFKRGNRLRASLRAPEGFDLAVIDSSQIECRLLNWLAGQWDVVEKFRRKEDPYIGLASEFYGRPITKADVAERGAGKQGELMCGYGCGGPKFARVARMGLYGPPIVISDDEGDRRVRIYRDTHEAVLAYWRAAEQVLSALAHGQSLQWGPMRIENHRMYTPAGLPLIYDTLEWYDDPETLERGWRLKTRQGWTRIWGSKLVQHVCEALAREIVATAMAKIAQAGYRLVGMSHDEIWVLIPKGDQAAFDFCLETMKVSPAWAPDLPLDAEGSFGDRYAK